MCILEAGWLLVSTNMVNENPPVELPVLLGTKQQARVQAPSTQRILNWNYRWYMSRTETPPRVASDIKNPIPLAASPENFMQVSPYAQETTDVGSFKEPVTLFRELLAIYANETGNEVALRELASSMAQEQGTASVLRQGGGPIEFRKHGNGHHRYKPPRLWPDLIVQHSEMAADTTWPGRHAAEIWSRLKNMGPLRGIAQLSLGVEPPDSESQGRGQERFEMYVDMSVVGACDARRMLTSSVCRVAAERVRRLSGGLSDLRSIEGEKLPMMKDITLNYQRMRRECDLKVQVACAFVDMDSALVADDLKDFCSCVRSREDASAKSIAGALKLSAPPSVTDTEANFRGCFDGGRCSERGYKTAEDDAGISMCPMICENLLAVDGNILAGSTNVRQSCILDPGTSALLVQRIISDDGLRSDVRIHPANPKADATGIPEDTTPTGDAQRDDDTQDLNGDTYVMGKDSAPVPDSTKTDGQENEVEETTTDTESLFRRYRTWIISIGGVTLFSIIVYYLVRYYSNTK